ncbi:hypothetical protein EG327_005409 [Venturia inaequalis]|uniref:Uncharacterized protein n=1 Tax=Venturia inaequalis TaxID=5025 RepID=A0A8H3V7X5_VENIN|nr:hypothetical protein EG327_005409 [Venturia inaequalis]
MPRIWKFGPALGLLASVMPSGSQALPTDIFQASIQTNGHIDEGHSTTVAVPSFQATAQLHSAQGRSIPVFIATESPLVTVSTVWVEENVTVIVTAHVTPTSSSPSEYSWTTATTPCLHGGNDWSSASEHSWTTATTPCLHDDDDSIIKPNMPGKRAVVMREPDVSTVWVEENVTITVNVLPSTGDTSQHSWTTATTPCLHDDDGSIIKPNIPGKRAVVVREPITTTVVVEEVFVITEEIVFVTITDSSSAVLDLSSMISNYNPTSTFTVGVSPPTPTDVPVPKTSSLSFVLPPIPHTSASPIKPEDVPGYWLKGGIVSTAGQAVLRRHAESSSVTTDYTHDVHPTIQANQWLRQFRNIVRKEDTTNSSTCVSTIPTLAAATTSCSTADAEEALGLKGSWAKYNRAREWLRRLVQRSDAPTVAKRDIRTSVIRTFSLKDFPPMTVYQLIDDFEGSAAPTTWTTSLFSRSHAADSVSTTSSGTTTRASHSASTPSLQGSSSLQGTALPSGTRSTTIWPDSATSWNPPSSPTPTSLEWDWWKGTKWQKNMAAEKRVRSAAAEAVEQKVEMSGWKRAEHDVNPWVITFGVVLAALTFALL